MADPTTLTNIAVPVIVGGIAGMTLSMTGVDKIYELSSNLFQELTKLDKKEFSTLASYKIVLSYTWYLIIAFFSAEVIVLIGILINYQTVVVIGYIILIFALALMLIFYHSIMNCIPQDYSEKNRPPIVKNFENVEKYPSP